MSNPAGAGTIGFISLLSIIGASAFYKSYSSSKAAKKAFEEKLEGSLTVINPQEIERILEALEIDLDGLRELGPKIIVKTCGANGSEIYSNEEKIKIDAVTREAIDPTGAGDSYRAGFLSRFLI